MSTPSPLQTGQSVGGERFTLVRALGRGGMGVVWLGQDTRLGEEVALKFLPPEVAADPVALNDLRRETARSHKLTHPNLVRIHDFQEQPDGVAFISMEFVDGPTLSAWRLEQPGQVLTWEQLAPLVQQLCAALDYAHGEGVIHRDLKPANVMLDSKGRLKLADFGIAAVVSDSVSRVSKLGTSGTLAYMSPQQLTGKRPSVTDDIYALGATLYELLTGQPPFYTGDITHQVLHEPPEPPAERLAALEVQNEVPADVAAILMACLSKDPAQRPQSAMTMAAWVGIEIAPKPSVVNLAQTMFSERPDSPDASAEAEPSVGEVAPAGSGKKLALAALGVLAIILLTGLGILYSGKHRAHSFDTRTGTGMPGQPPAIPEEGFVSLFNGRDLAGWDGNPKLWSVKDGAIVGETTRENHAQGNTFLLWTNGTPTDFELRCSARLTPRNAKGFANSGIQYRSRVLDAAQWGVGGYQADMDAGPAYSGILYEEGMSRGIMAARGEKVLWDKNCQKQITGLLNQAEEVQAAIKKEDWNDYVIIASGNHLQHFINGKPTVDVTDECESKASKSGVLALQLHAGEPMRAEFKDIRLKRLGNAVGKQPLKVAGDGKVKYVWCEDWFDADKTFRVVRRGVGGGPGKRAPEVRAWDQGFCCVLELGGSAR